MRRTVIGCALFLLGTAGGGCALLTRSEHHRSSSVVSFLFPDEVRLVQEPGLPVLRLPLRVGIAFVPEEPGYGGVERFSETRKIELMRQVADEFRALPFVESIQTVPELYLRHGGGFQNLDQVRALLGIDVIVLLSYDQAQFSTDNKKAVAYWTLVGAYIVKGNRNDTHTLMEATVYDIPSRTLLFRAPGVDLTRASSTLVYADIQLARDSEGSFTRATADVVTRLQGELETFQEAVKSGNARVTVEHRPGYKGGGALDSVSTTLMILGLAAAACGMLRRVTGRRSPAETT